jgi:hypothetical protein
MKITIESTSTLTLIGGSTARLWEGTTEAGATVWVFVTLISAPADADTAELDEELVRLMRDADGSFVTFEELHS